MGREIWHSALLVVVIGLGFLFPHTPLADFDLQITAILFIIYFISRRFMKSDRVLESTLFTLIILIIINTTGGLSSPFFFLLYFLIFGLTLLIEPVVSIIAALTAIIFFLMNLPPNPTITMLSPILALGLLAPFAMFMGQEYVKNQELHGVNDKQKEDTMMFLSVSLKNQLRTIKESIENFVGDKQLSQIKKSTKEMENLIEKFEKENS